MNEKQKKVFFKRLQIVLFVTIISSTLVLLLLWFVVPLFVTYSEPALSPYIKTLKQKLKNEPNNIVLQKEFIHAVIQEQERIEDPNKKNDALLAYTITVAEQYLHTQNDVDIKIAFARLYFQSGNVAKIRGNMLKAASLVQKGTNVFDDLMEQHANNILVRLFRAINFASIPRFFGKGTIAISDFKYLATTILSNNFDIVKEIPTIYYQRSLLYCLERAKPYIKKHASQNEQADIYKTIDAAYRKAQDSIK